MSPYTFAKLECCDFFSGRCLWTADGGCLLARKPLKPCRLFERNVLNLPMQPGADKHPNYFAYAQARQSYLRTCKQETVEIKLRPCLDCGGALRKRQRICAGCAKKRRRQAYRKAQAKRRMAVNS